MEFDKDLDEDMDDEELVRLEMMYDEVRDLLKNNFLNEYVACYLQALHKYEFLKRKTTPLFRHVNSCIDEFNNVNYEDVNFDKVKDILKEKYRLKIAQEEPYLELEEI